MASDTGFTENVAEVRTDDDVSRDKQLLENVEDRLLTLSDQITLLNRVLVDLKGLHGVIERKSLQDESIPLQK